MEHYMCIKSDPANGLIEGKKVAPYYEDANELIIESANPSLSHHIRKNGQYFTEHLQPMK